MPDPDSHGRRLNRRQLIVWILLLLLIGLVLLHLAWTRHERSKLMAVVQGYRSAGEPVLAEDFEPPAAQDPNNPIPEWRAAVAALQGLKSKLYERIDRAEFSVPLSDAEDDLLRQFVDQNQTALAHAEAASRMHGRPDWQIHFTAGPAITVLLPDLQQQRQLARILAWSALDAHHRHDDAQAVDRLLQLLAQSRAVEHQPGLVGHLVAIGLEAMACDTLRTIGPELRIGSAAGSSDQSASPQQVLQLIAELLDERPLRAGQTLAFRSERMFELDTALRVATGELTWASITSNSPGRADSSPPLQGMISYAMAPVAYDDARLLIQQTTGVLKAAQSPDFIDAQAALDAMPDYAAKRGPRHPLLSVLMPAMQRAITQDFRILTESRLAAVMLACRWYAQEHEGQWPRDLEELVPTYLPAVPRDPFTAGSAVRYRPGPDPIVYGVGENQKDDGGSEQPLGTQRQDNRWAQLDYVTHLTLQPHAAPPQDPGEETDAVSSTEPTSAPTTQPGLP